jgi:hypothetical protein
VCGPRCDTERRERIGRDTAEAWLQPDVAAERRRDAHRAGAVGADADRSEASSESGCLPPDEPPGVRVVFHELRVMPVSGELVSPLQPNSGVVVLPTSTAPASHRRAVTDASTSHAWFGSTARLPRRVGHPRVRIGSLIDTGTPFSGPAGSPACQRRSLAAAAAAP